MTRICDYEGSRYRTEFWENAERRYEDLAERIALKNMLPPVSQRTGKRLIEVGAGFGRLVDMYQGYEQIILVDYARTQLEEAQRYLGHDERFVFVVADVYNLPFVDNLIDTLVMIRVMHHLVDVPAALRELHRTLAPNAAAIIEHASKRHLKAILRWYLGRQDWNPFNPAPHEFVELNIDFHPEWMQAQFAAANLDIQAIRSLSYLRIPFLKNIIPPRMLANLDGLLQPTGQRWQYSPSIFLKATPLKETPTIPSGFFKCPACQQTSFTETAQSLTCTACQQVWAIEDGIYMFKMAE